MQELDHFVVANKPRIPCTVRTLKPYWSAGKRVPFVHYQELAEALLYLAIRAELPDAEIHALKELHEKLFSLIADLSVTEDHPQGNGQRINGQ